ncbi:hypothetical protein ACS0TY_003932 [Phlomoides rotata]
MLIPAKTHYKLLIVDTSLSNSNLASDFILLLAYRLIYFAVAWAIENHPDRLPVVLENAWGSQLPDLDQKTFLVPAVYTVGQFAHSIREAKLHHLAAEKPIYLFVKNIPLPTAASMSTLYEEHKDADDILYMTYSH